MYKVIGDLPVAGKGQGETLTDADLADANVEALIEAGHLQAMKSTLKKDEN